MTQRYDALAVRESNDKSYFTKIGVAFPMKDGKGFSVLLDAIPAPTEGQFKILLREPLPKRDPMDQSRPANEPAYSDLDDDTPF